MVLLLFTVGCPCVSMVGFRIAGGLELRSVCIMYDLSFGEMSVRYALFSYGSQSKDCGLGILRYVYAIKSIRGPQSS